MFIAGFRAKTAIQKLLFNVREILDYPQFHPGRELLREALRDSVAYAQENMPYAVSVETAREALDLALKYVSVVGHYLEFGVFKGGTIRYLAQRLRPGCVIHGFDSFEGLPEKWTGNTSSFDMQGRLPKVPSNVQLHRGYFDQSLPVWLERNPGPVAFVHIDCDLYRSTKTIFNCLAPRLARGTIIAFDEYFNYPQWRRHEFKAFQEFVKTHQVEYEYLAFARLQVVVRILQIGPNA